MIDKALLAKIRKCMALASSSNEHEAAAALAKAHALMDEHGITSEQLAMADIEEAKARASRTQTPPRWENYLCAAVDRALGVTSFIDERGDRAFIGRGPTAEIAAYAFGVLFRQMKVARADFISSRLSRCKLARKRARADIFCEGWASSVYTKIVQLMPQREPDPVVSQYLAEHHPGLVPVQERSAKHKGLAAFNDYLAGRLAGDEAKLHHGVAGRDGMAALT